MALLVLLGGLFLLAYAKKEGLGMMTKIASYIAILVSTGMLICCIVCALMCGHCKGDDCSGGKCEKGGMKCEKEIIIKHGDGMMMHGGEHCKKDASCSKDSASCCKHEEKEVKVEVKTK